jgi:hypothetical protein
VLGSRPVYVTLALVLLFAVAEAWSYATADAKIAPDLLAATAPANAIVRLRFVPEKFHMLLLQELGRVESSDGRDVRMLDVAPGRLRAFARHYWVASIEAYAPGSPSSESTGSAPPR